MTFEEVRVAALQRLMEFGGRFNAGHQVPFRRIAVRQQQLFAAAARANPEYAGVCATGTLEDGEASLAAMAPPVKRPEAITLVEVLDPGESGYAIGQRITIVGTFDDDGVTPRARLRNRSVIGVDGELDDVISIKVSYPYIPEGPDTDETGSREIEMAEPYTELLVIDLARELIRKDLSMKPDDRAAVVALYNEEEAGLFSEWLAHAAGYAPIENRFR